MYHVPSRTFVRHLSATSIAIAIALSSVTPLAATERPWQAPSSQLSSTTGTFYVSPSGNDSNRGTLNSPWRTLQRAADVVSPGVTVVLRQGTYAGFTLRRSGASGAPIVFRPYTGETAVIRGDSARAHVINLVDVHHVQLRKLTVQEAPVAKGSGIRIARSHHIRVVGSRVRRNNSYGVLIESSSQVVVRNNVITRNATGVRVRYGGKGVIIEKNRIFRNDRMTVNDPQPGNDTGGQGIAFEKTSGGAVARNNRIWGNRATSYDYGEDGAAIEIFGSSNLVITRNRMWNNRAVLETGTNDKYACSNNRITHNVAWRATSKTSVGMVLRCAKDTVVAHNSLDDLTWWAMQLSHRSGSFGSSVDGLRVMNNIVRGVKTFHINTALPSSVQLDYNLVWAPNKHVAYVVGKGYTKELSEFRAWTGYEQHGLNKAPRFVNPGNRNYRLKSYSPAIDRGAHGVTNAKYRGAAPDLGRYEFVP